MEANIRKATEADLPIIFRTQMTAFGFHDVIADVGLDFVTSILRHTVNSGDAMVAEVDGQLAGFGIALERDGTRFVSHLFVNPELQSAGLGRDLMAAILPDISVPSATVGSEDLRAQALYIRAGLLPSWPHYTVAGPAEHAQQLPETGLTVVEVESGDPKWLVWDHKYARRKRAGDIEFLERDWGFVKLWLEDRGERLGYGGVSFRFRGADAAVNPDGVVVGPVGAADPLDSARCLMALMQWAAGQPGAGRFAIDLPGPHPVIVPLLEAGFRLEEQQVFFASIPNRFGYPRLYVPTTAALY